MSEDSGRLVLRDEEVIAILRQFANEMPALAFARLVDEFAERFARDNPHFDRVAFMRACLGP